MVQIFVGCGKVITAADGGRIRISGQLIDVSREKRYEMMMMTATRSLKRARQQMCNERHSCNSASSLPTYGNRFVFAVPKETSPCGTILRAASNLIVSSP